MLDSEALATDRGELHRLELEGNVTIRVTNLGPDVNAIVNGIFFGPAIAATTSIPIFVKIDATTGGNWSSSYGGDGYDIAKDNSGANPSLPSYAR